MFWCWTHSCLCSYKRETRRIKLLLLSQPFFVRSYPRGLRKKKDLKGSKAAPFDHHWLMLWSSFKSLTIMLFCNLLYYLIQTQKPVVKNYSLRIGSQNSRPTSRQYRRKEFTVFLWEYLKGRGCETVTCLTLTLTWLYWSIKVFDLTVFGTKHGVCRGRHRLLEYAIGSVFFPFQMKVWSLLFGTKCLVYRSQELDKTTNKNLWTMMIGWILV